VRIFLVSVFFIVSFLPYHCFSREIPAFIAVNNDFAIFAGTSTSIDRLVYQNNSDCLSATPFTLNINADETYIYILAMGGDPSWYWDKREDLSGTINGKNIADISSIEKSSDVSPYLTDYVTSRDTTQTIAYGTYSVTLEDILSALPNLIWTPPTPSGGLEIPNRYGFGLGYPFQTGEAFIFKIPVSDLENGQNGDWQYSFENNEITITGYNGVGGNLTIPNQIQLLGSQSNIPVKTIGNNIAPVFGMNNSSVIKVIIPSGVMRIANNAFWEAKSLQEISIPNTVTSIGEKAFAVCYSLNNVTIPNSVTVLGKEAFYWCTSLTSITLSENIASIEASLFSLCENLVSINIPNGINILEDYAFNGCNNLSSIVIPTGVTSVGQAFKDCPNLTSILFLGNAPISTGNWINCPAYVLRNTAATGWESNFSGRPVYLSNGDSNNDGISDVQAIALGYSPSINFLPFINNLKTNPVAGLYNQTQYDGNYTNGKNHVLGNPNSFNLYETNQIHNLGLGGIVLNRNTNNQLILNYQVLQSTDLQNWSLYQQYELPITNAPSDKMFLRVQAVGQ